MPRKLIEKRKAESLEGVMVRLTIKEREMLDTIQNSMAIIKENRGETVTSVPSYSEVVGRLLTAHSQQ